MDIFCQYLATSNSHVRNPSDCVSKVCLVPWGGGRDQAGQLGDYQCQANGQHWGCQEAVLQLIGADDQQGETFDTLPSLVRPCQYCNTSNKYLYNVLGFGSSFLLACRRPGLLCFVGWALSKPVSLPASDPATRYLGFTSLLFRKVQTSKRSQIYMGPRPYEAINIYSSWSNPLVPLKC